MKVETTVFLAMFGAYTQGLTMEDLTELSELADMDEIQLMQELDLNEQDMQELFWGRSPTDGYSDGRLGYSDDDYYRGRRSYRAPPPPPQPRYAQPQQYHHHHHHHHHRAQPGYGPDPMQPSESPDFYMKRNGFAPPQEEEPFPGAPKLMKSKHPHHKIPPMGKDAKGMDLPHNHPLKSLKPSGVQAAPKPSVLAQQNGASLLSAASSFLMGVYLL